LGEDPYLTGVLATQFIRGIQGNDPKYYKAIATSKHLAVHSGPEPLRHGFNVDPSLRDLFETYLPAFRRTVTEGKVASIMCAYNAIDGKPACANPELLGGIVRKDWNFAGSIVSDCGAIADIAQGHKFTKDILGATVASIKAGTDLACAFQGEYLEIPGAVRAGLLRQAEVDQALRRMIEDRMRLGLFDPKVPFGDVPYSANHSPANRAVALRAARESIVLLKNDGLLPLVGPGRKVAVVGPGAASLISLEGNYNGTPVGAVLPVDGIAAGFGSANVRYAQGSTFVAGSLVPVPRSAFPGGLSASFFNGTGFAGAPVATRMDAEIDHNWKWIAPAPGVDPRSFSVRWTGTFVPPGPGEYRLDLQRRDCEGGASVDRFRIMVDGFAPREVDGGCGKAKTAESAPMKLQFPDATPRRITIEYAHRSANWAPAITLAWEAPAEALRAEAIKAAEQSDVIIAFVGLNPALEGEEMPVKLEGFDGGDRTDISLPSTQRDLLKALQATGKPVVIVLQSGSAVALGEEGRKAKAILAAWYGGEAGGQAIADVLSGAVNPSGRLPVTFYASNDQLPPFGDYSMDGRTYRYFDGQPEYAFGHGLSYTRFAYSTPVTAPGPLAAGKSHKVNVLVRNTGKREGDEVVQLYLTALGRDGAPLRSLKAFERVHLQPGEDKMITFALQPRDLALADDQGVMRITPGEYRLWVGGGQPGTVAPGRESSFRVTGSATLPR
jgi:beta-glucosidase